MKNVGLGILFIAGAIVGGWIMLIGFDRTEVVECLKWQNEAKEYQKYYLTAWQDEQCRAHSIVVDAPVKH